MIKKGKKGRRSNTYEDGRVIDSTKCGIYKATCLVNNKVLVGQSENYPERALDHLRDLKRGAHYNKYFQAAYNKYGAENFIFQLFELCDVRELDDREIFWIDELKARDRNFGYNLAPGGKTITGKDYYKYIGQEITCNKCLCECRRETWGYYSGYCVECANEYKKINKVRKKEKAKLDARKYRKNKGGKPRNLDKPKIVTYKKGSVCPCKSCNANFTKLKCGIYSQYCPDCVEKMISETKEKKLIKDREHQKKYRDRNKEDINLRRKKCKRIRKPLSTEQKLLAAERLRIARQENPEQFKEYDRRRCPIKRAEQRKRSYLKNKQNETT